MPEENQVQSEAQALGSYRLLRPLLFQLDPEQTHEAMLHLLSMASTFSLSRCLLRLIFAGSNQGLEQHFFGLTFPNPIGLAAGFDKNARLIRGIDKLGFGFAEVGTITPRPQPGNPKPRMFRDASKESLTNCLGFNNQGADKAKERLKRHNNRPIPIGVNIGKNRDTTLENAKDDYCHALETVFAYADYITINISSPNTPGLRDLQKREQLDPLLAELQETNQRLSKQLGLAKRPMLVKFAPECDEAAIKDIAELIQKHAYDGVIATNTLASEKGGISGKPLKPHALRSIKLLRSALGPKMPIVGLGGISSATDALEFLEAGANLLQIYTGLVYRGPLLIKNLKQGLIAARRQI